MRSIRSRLLILLLTGLTIVLVAGGLGVYWIEQSSLLQQFDESLLTRAQTIASMLVAEPAEDDDGNFVIEEKLDGGDAPAAVVQQTYFEYHIPEGRVLYRSPTLAGMELETRQPLEGAPEIADVDLPEGLAGRAIWMRFTPRLDVDDEEDWIDVDPAEVQVQPRIVVAAMDRGPVDRALATLAGALTTVGVAVWLTIASLVIFGVRWGLRPLNRLRRQLGGVHGAGVHEQIEDRRAPHELQPVYRELNRMLARVEQTLERERSFAGAAAHELRTPLAELRSTSEVALRWPDSSRAHTALEESLAIGREMEQLVESLLLISRGQATRGDMALKPVRVQPIINECINRARTSIARRHLEVANELPDDDTLPGSPEAVEIILRNLIDNAVHYTPEGGSIAIRDGHPNNGISSVVVENGPVSLEESDLEWLFRPFWQKEKSRTNRRHIGLGLAVVRQAAEVCKLSVEATLAGDRLCVTVERIGSNGSAAPQSA